MITLFIFSLIYYDWYFSTVLNIHDVHDVNQINIITTLHATDNKQQACIIVHKYQRELFAMSRDPDT